MMIYLFIELHINPIYIYNLMYWELLNSVASLVAYSMAEIIKSSISTCIQNNKLDSKLGQLENWLLDGNKVVNYTWETHKTIK